MINAGRVLIVPQGAWTNLTPYEMLDLVSEGDKAYIARQASVGVRPSEDLNMTYWQPFGSSASIATTDTPGLVMPDGVTITVDATGLIVANLNVADLKDIKLTNLANGDVLKYDGAQSKWVNVALGTAATKNATSLITSGNTGLIESGAVYLLKQTLETDIQALTNNTYSVNDTAITEVASNDLLPIYDTSASGKKKIAVDNFIGRLVSNPNLLDNPWFTVNQRGQSSYNGNGYSVDRWRGWNATKDIIVTQNGVSTFGLWQYFDNSFTSFLLGQTITMSVKMQNGNIHSKTVTLPATEPSQDANFLYSNNSDDNISFAIDYESSRGIIDVSIRNLYDNNSALVRAVKLELGSVSTLMLDTAPNYATELLKCQRYFISFNPLISDLGNGGAVGVKFNNIGVVVLNIPIPVAMRAKPVLSVTNYGFIVYGDGTTFTPSSIVVDDVFNNVLRVFASIAQTAGAKTAVWQDCKFTASADL